MNETANLAPKAVSEMLPMDEPASNSIPGDTGSSATSNGEKLSLRPWLAALTVMVGFYTAYVAHTLLIPIAFAILASLILAPPVRLLCALRIPRPLGAFIVVVLSLTVAAGLVSSIAVPAQQWMERAPASMQRLEGRMREWRRPFEAASAATERVMSLGHGSTAPDTPPVIVDSPGPLSALLSSAPTVIATLLASVFLTFLLLMQGENVLRKFMSFLPEFRSKKYFVSATREIQSELSHYLLTISLINTGLGMVTAAALYGLGVPDPLLWGGIVGLLNFAPYVGPALGTVILILVGFSEQPETSFALAPAAVFLLFHGLEGQLITPLLLGRRLAIDPVAIFLALMLFGWLWGIAGLLMAVPILTCLKVTGQHVPDAAPWARLLGVSDKVRPDPSVNQ